MYNIPESDWVLPNPGVVDYGGVNVHKSEKPTIVYVGRLDPIKRPWVFVELAKKFPEADFLMLGKSHFDGEDDCKIQSIRENLKLMEHVTGPEKYKIISSAWIFINTSNHEDSPVLAFEALAYETPLVCYEDWGNLVSRHGIAVGQRQGTGLNGLPGLADAVKTLFGE